MKRIWLSPDLQDFQAHRKALQTLPQVYRIVEDATLADFKLTNENSPDLVLNQIIQQISSNSLESYVLKDKFLSFRAFYRSLPSKDDSVEFICKLLNKNREIVEKELSFEFTKNALIITGEIDGSILSMIFIVSEQVGVFHKFVLSDRTSKLVIEIPVASNASGTRIRISSIEGTLNLRPHYESSAKEFWIGQDI